MPTIPASAIVSVNPSVIGAGGSALDLNGLLLTDDTRPPIGSVLSFPSAQAVSDYFGPSSDEADAADIYFNGFDNSNVKPGALLISQYPLTPVAAFLRGGDVSALTLTQLQALVGTLILTVDGYERTASSFSLSSATSFSSAAALIEAALNLTSVVAATSTNSTIAGAVLTVGGTVTGTFAVGQTVTGSGVTADSIITSLGTGTGGAGTYNLSQSSTVSIGESISGVATPVAVTYDSVSGAFVVTSGVLDVESTMGFATGTLATALKLTEATGAVTSQGATTATPETAMDAIVEQTTNWASFMTLFNPDGSGNANKQLFAAWTNAQNNRYAYVAWDTDITPTLSTAATNSLGYLLKQLNSSGTLPVYAPDYKLAMFICGFFASLDFTQFNGRATLAFKSQTGTAASVTGRTVGDNLIANGYNFYGAYATANNQFVFMNPGLVSGPFAWADSYINQIWLNNSFQLALMTLLTQIKSLPYNDAGYSLIRAACMDPITAAVNFGAIRVGVPLSALQAAEVKNASGIDIAPTLFSQGWYLQILPATAIVRGARTSPPMTFWYMDGGSIQKLNLASVEIQ